LRAHKSIIVETNFNPSFANKRFLELKEKYGFTPIQVRCIANGEILFERFKNRANSTERHLGHVDNVNLEEWEPIIKKGKIEALEIGGNIFDIDTTDIETIDYVKLLSDIRSITHPFHEQSNTVSPQTSRNRNMHSSLF
jgi:hypothetical protein